jgi:dihydroorotase
MHALNLHYGYKVLQKYDRDSIIFHLSTERARSVTNMIPFRKAYNSRSGVHHLHFSSDDYARLGNQIKCNPAIKGRKPRGPVEGITG